MHSLIGAWQEANQIYTHQSQLLERSSLPIHSPLIIFDVGLGIAANALATLEAYHQLPAPKRDLEIWSFETNLNGLKFAIDQIESFDWLKPYKNVVQELLDRRCWRNEDGSIRWHLKEGDFFHNLSIVPIPEIIFYDFYSSKTCPELWSEKSFTKILDHWKKDSLRELLLITYSAASSIRKNLKNTGFEVSQGVATAKKRETTLARARASSTNKAAPK